VADAIPFKYRAFLSYSHRDKAWGKWLHTALEGYRIDRDLVGRRTPSGPVPKTLRPIFRDREDFSAGHSLTAQTLAALEASQFLVVLCSPNAAHSPYVNEEIRRFKAMGRADRVIPVIVDGQPSEPVRNCFPPALCFNIGPDGTYTEECGEPIAADARPDGDGKEVAKQKIVAGILRLGLDEIIRRAEQVRKRQTRLRRTIVVTLLGLSIASVGGFSWARYELSRNEMLLDRTLERATSLVNKATSLSDRFGVPRVVSLGFLDEAEYLFKDLAELGRDTPQLRFRKASMLLAFAKDYEALGQTDKQHERALEAHRLMKMLVAEEPGNTDWQNVLSLTYEQIGDLLMNEGYLNESLEAYGAGLEIGVRLATVNPTNAILQFNVIVFHQRIGDIHIQQGHRGEALTSYFAAQATAIDYLKRGDAGTIGVAVWLDALSHLETLIGESLGETGQLNEALESFRRALEWTEVIAEESTRSLRKRSLIHADIGSILLIQGKLDEALESFRAGLTIAQRLAAADGHNVFWQRDLSVLHSKLARVLAVQGHLDIAMLHSFRGTGVEPNAAEQKKLSESLQNLRASLAIQQHFVDVDPTNTKWQADIGDTYKRIGDLLITQKNFNEALGSYRAALVLSKSLASHDPSNIRWYADLTPSLMKFAVMLLREGKSTKALSILEESNAIAKHATEADPENVALKVNAIISDLFLATYDTDPVPRVETIVSELRMLKQQSKLSPAEVSFSLVIEEALEQLKSHGYIDSEEIWKRLVAAH
jgi:tetratricopeptide (TPR) repeat protein